MNIHHKKTEILELRRTNDSPFIDEVYDMLYLEVTVKNINLKELPGDLQQKINKALTLTKAATT